MLKVSWLGKGGSGEEGREVISTETETEDLMGEITQ